MCKCARSVSLSLSLSFGTVYLLKYLSCHFAVCFSGLQSICQLYIICLCHFLIISLHCVFFTVCPVLQFGQEVPFTEKTRESCYKVEWRVLPYLHACVFLVPLTSAFYFFFFFFNLRQFYYKKGSWFICMLFRWAFASTKGSYSCTWLAPKGISWVGVYLVCLPWFKKSCFKSETIFPHFFSCGIWILPAFQSLPLSVLFCNPEHFFRFAVLTCKSFSLLLNKRVEVWSIQRKLNE